MPIPPEQVRFDLPNSGPHGCWVRISVAAGALRPLGLHPDQPTSHASCGSPPAWWHAEAEKRGW